jgi:sterol O-acyltransferase
MFLFTVQTYISSLERHGYALSMAFAHMFSRHAVTLALSDGFLVGTTALCVVFGKALSKGWIKYYPTGLIIQHVFQTLVLTSAITWTFNR